MRVTKEGIKRELIRIVESHIKNYIKQIVDSPVRVAIDDKYLESCVETANRKFPNKTDIEFANTVDINIEVSINKHHSNETKASLTYRQ